MTSNLGSNLLLEAVKHGIFSTHPISFSYLSPTHAYTQLEFLDLIWFQVFP